MLTAIDNAVSGPIKVVGKPISFSSLINPGGIQWVSLTQRVCVADTV